MVSVVALENRVLRRGWQILLLLAILATENSISCEGLPSVWSSVVYLQKVKGL